MGGGQRFGESWRVFGGERWRYKTGKCAPKVMGLFRSSSDARTDVAGGRVRVDFPTRGRTVGGTSMAGLHAACRSGNADAVRTLLEDTDNNKNAIDARNHEDNTPLLVCSHWGHAPCVRVWPQSTTPI